MPPPQFDAPDDDERIQLELFDYDAEPPRLALSCDLARRTVSPGWWPVVRRLFEPGRSSVHVLECREEHASLVLEVVTPVPELRPGLELLADHIRIAVARTCGCCGRSDSDVTRHAVEGTERVVCPACLSRLRQGATWLAIADEYWRLDGSPRAMLDQVTELGPPGRETRTASSPRLLGNMAADELRRIMKEIRTRMASRVWGLGEPVARLSLLGAMHVAGGMNRGARALLLGPSGAGKTALLGALRYALEPWQLPWVMTDALDMTSPGWSGAPSIGDLVEAALAGAAPDDVRARHAVVVVDEIHHARVTGDATGNSRQKREEVLASLLALAGGGIVHLGEGTREWSSAEALVFFAGAFTGLLDLRRSVAVEDLVRTGLPLELATRIAEEIILVRPLPEADLLELLRRWPPLLDLVALCEHLGYRVRIPDQTIGRAARVVALRPDSATVRTAGGWLVTALRHALLGALDEPAIGELLVPPDALPIGPTALQAPGRGEPPDDESGGWNATIVLTPR
jgi:ATPase family associated with various cellular activities (AAA)